jgi:hypothetical protein
MNTPGRSLYVWLQGPDSGPGAAGKWTDAATGEHGDLLDLIACNRDLQRLGDTMVEARCFLALPRLAALSGFITPKRREGGSPEAARPLFHTGCFVPGTPAEAYLRARGITARLDWPALRYHPSVYRRASANAPLEQCPALLAAVTALDGTITGILRTWLDRNRPTKAPLADPRRALGHLLGNGVRFGEPSGILAAGEGVETILALRDVCQPLECDRVDSLPALHRRGARRQRLAARAGAGADAAVVRIPRAGDWPAGRSLWLPSHLAPVPAGRCREQPIDRTRSHVGGPVSGRSFWCDWPSCGDARGPGDGDDCPKTLAAPQAPGPQSWASIPSRSVTTKSR